MDQPTTRWGLVPLVLCFALLLAAPVAMAASDGLPAVYVYEERGEVEVITSLGAYLFSVEDAALRSAYLYYETWGAQGGELVPGTTTQLVQVDAEALGGAAPILKQERPILRRLLSLRFSFPLLSYIAYREYAPGTTFPFSIEGQDEGFELLFAERDATGKAIVEFGGSVGGLDVVKRFIFEDVPYYAVGVEIEATNPGDAAVDLKLNTAGYTPGGSGPALVYLFDGVRSDVARERGAYARFEGIGLVDKRTVFFLGADASSELSPFVAPTTDVSARFGVSWQVAPGTQTVNFTLYGGRRRFLLMEDAGIEAVDDPGTAARLIVPIVRFLELLHRTTGNYGWAIILFTLMTRIVLFPLMRKQYHSIAKTQRIQPRLKKIQERYKNDRQMMQQKTLEIYKKEGVNPMGGCLPMLIQLPIIFVIWRAMLYASEQIHLSPGFLWIPDLSLHDPLFILVIVTTAIMIVQQKFMSPMGTGDAKGVQKYMGYFFPVMMAVLLWRFPAGLWLYYLLTTGAQVGQQAIVNWEMARAGDGPSALSADEDDLDLEMEESDGDEGASEGD